MGRVINFDKAKLERKWPKRVNAAGLATLFEQDMLRSGLSAKEGGRLGYNLQDGSDGLYCALHPGKEDDDRPDTFTAAGYTIDYFDPLGKRINFRRGRSLTGKFDTREKEKQRYSQPPKSMPHIYLVPRWASALPMPGDGGKMRPPWLVITEGEKKAAIANMCGIPCIALGGIYNFKAAAHQQAVLEELRLWFDLSGTEMTFCYDVDVFGAKEVANAMYQCMHAMRVHLRPKAINEIRLNVELLESKLALDDYLSQFTERTAAGEAFRQLDRIVAPLDQEMAALNKAVAWDLSRKHYYDIANGKFFRSQRDVLSEHRPNSEIVDPNEPKRKTSAADYWLDHRDTSLTNIQDVVFAPGEPDRFRARKSDPQETMNIWRPGDLEPIAYAGKSKDKKRLEPFIQYWEYFTAPTRKAHPDDNYDDWLLQWFAYPLQHPGAKLLQAVIAVSTLQGTGKTTIGMIARQCYGLHNSAKLDGAKLADDFNENWALKQFLLVEEVYMSIANRRALMQSIKDYITGTTISVRRMHVARYEARNVLNWYLTSNHMDALPLEQDDRRFMVIHAPESLWGANNFGEFYQWLNGNPDPQSRDYMSGYRSVYGYLKALDLTGFEPHGHAPRTQARTEMLAATQTSGDSMLQELVDLLVKSPHTILDAKGRGGKTDVQLWDAHELVKHLSEYAAENNLRLFRQLSSNQLGLYLSAHDIPRERDIKYKGRMHVVYAIFERKHWRSANRKQWIAEWSASMDQRRGK